MYEPNNDGKGCYGCYGSSIRARHDAKYFEDILAAGCRNCYSKDELAKMPRKGERDD